MSGDALERFVASQILNVRRSPTRTAPPLARCLRVKAVAAVSPAAHAGIGPGDLLVSLNGQSAGVLDPELFRLRAAERSYVFFRPSSHEKVEVTATRIDPGLELQRTPESVIASYKPETFDVEPLVTLWEAGAWDALEKLSGLALQARKGDRNSPALVFLGAARYELGRRDEGFALVQEYVQKYVRNWTTGFRAVAGSVVAKRCEAEGDRAKAITILLQAFDDGPYDRIADAIEALGVPRPKPKTMIAGRQFPGDYELPTLVGAQRTLTLSEALLAMRAGQLFLVCLLDGYRGNGPYNDFMHRYQDFVPTFESWLTGLHVVTEIAERPPDRDYYFRYEDEAIAKKLPLEILLDHDGAQTSSVRPLGSPFVMALDKDAVVRAEGEMSGIDLWRALGAANS